MNETTSEMAEDTTAQQKIDAVQQWLEDPSRSVFVQSGLDHEDDEFACFVVSFCGIDVEWLFADEDAYAAAKYANDSPSARRELVSLATNDLLVQLFDDLQTETDDNN